MIKPVLYSGSRSFLASVKDLRLTRQWRIKAGQKVLNLNLLHLLDNDSMQYSTVQLQRGGYHVIHISSES